MLRVAPLLVGETHLPPVLVAFEHLYQLEHGVVLVGGLQLEGQLFVVDHLDGIATGGVSGAPGGA